MTEGPGIFGFAVVEGPDHTLVALRGELDMYNVSRLRECLLDLASKGNRKVILDLSDVVFIDSSGLGVLATAMKAFRSAGGDMALTSPNRSVQKVLEISGITKLLPVVDHPGPPG